MKNKTKLFSILFSILINSLISIGAVAQDIPDAPNPPRLVNDFVGFLSAQEQNYLERKLVAFDDSTSTQIAIVIVKTLNGLEPNEYATELGRKWGVGRKEQQRNNGIVILVKPKTAEEKGRIYIATGYGMESFVTDALSKRIIENEIKPSFSKGQYFDGLNKAVDALISISKGQYTADEYIAKKKKKKEKGFPWAIVIIIGILVLVFFSRGSRGSGSRHISSGSDLPFWMLLGGLMNSGRSGGAGFGDFSSGGGDFGGFGGGDFGGGGAGGEW